MLDKAKYARIERQQVTAVVPVYNEERCIKDCILSLKNQTIAVEIVIVDDGSTDQTVAICESLGVRVLRQKHKGPGAARNLGARKASGNILVLGDADMTFTPEYVERLIEPIVDNQAIATCHWNERVANWENPWARCQTYDLGLPDRRRQPLDMPAGEQIYRAVKKDFFLKHGGHSEKRSWGEDSSIYLKTGVLADIVTGAKCYHRNLENAIEVFAHSAWKGRNVAIDTHKSIRRALASILYNNPIKRLTKGLIIGFRKKEPFMVMYELFYSLGFLFGMAGSLFVKKHAK